MALLAFVCLLLFAAGGATAAPGDYIKSFGPDGTAGTQFERPAAMASDQKAGTLYVGDSETQTLYKFDEEGNPLNWGGSAGYISGHEVTGLSLNSGGSGRTQVAVDSQTHVVYVISANKVRAFEANGEPHNFTAGPGAGTSEFTEGIQLFGLAVDDAGNLYVSDYASGSFTNWRTRIYSRSGAKVTELSTAPARPGNLAVAGDGTLYITSPLEEVYAFEPSNFPVTPGTTYGSAQPLQGDAFSTSVAVDPATEYVYVGETCKVDPCEFRMAVFDELGRFVGAIGAEGPGKLEGLPAGIGVNGAAKRVYAAVRASSLTGISQVAVFETLQLPVEQPEISGLGVTGVTSTSATLQARINPHTLDTTYQFEYGPEDCVAEPESCTKVPITPVSIGAGHTPVPVSVSLSGLNPGAKYFYRITAENSLGVSEEPEAASRSFTTQKAQFGSGLSDSRVWELVTPTNKFGGVPTNSNLLQADPNGSGIAFQTRGSLVEDPEGNRALETSSALARRSGSGQWSVSDLVPPHTEAGGLGFGPEFKLFSSDLGKAVLEPRDDTLLSVESSERAPNLRTNTDPPSYRPLVTSKEGFANVPEGTVFGGEATGERNPVSIAGADTSLDHILLSSKAALVPGAQERSLYLWSNGALEPVSELPASKGGAIVGAQPGSAAVSVRNAISEDGSRVFWSPGGNAEFPTLSWTALYLRDTIADETHRIDVAEEGVTGPGEPHPVFMAASADGSVVYFTDSQQLTADASPEGRDLYRCEIGDVGGGALGCTELEDLSAPLEGSEENGEAEELAVGVSEDGGRVYFIARAVLDPEPNESGETAVPGDPNLYLWQEGEGVRLVAPLSELDAADWGSGVPNPVGQGSRSAGTNSPDGRYLAFMSQQNLAGAETNDPETGEPVEQAFLYDAAEDRLACISCNPSGATDAGHLIAKDASEGGVVFPDPQQLWGGRLVGATLAETAEGEPNVGFALYWPRAVLDNGRAYFNSTSPLVNSDSNGTWDVYQYEPFGLGDCGPLAASGTVATTETGCISLLSSGTDSLPSVFMDASASGNDVFFATFARLSALDTDTIVDVYDARVGGAEATVEQHTQCSGEACQPSGSPPGAVSPNSATFIGPGNVKTKPAKRCKKGQRKVKRNGQTRCVKQKKKKSGKHNRQREGAKSKGRT